MNDPRAKFFVNISGCYLGASLEEETWEKDIIGQTSLGDFLDNSKTNILHSYMLENKLCFDINLPKNDYASKIIFTKIKPCVLTKENMRDSVQITTISGSPTLILYNILDNVSPIIQGDETGLLRKQIDILQSDLRSSLFSSKTIDENDDNSLSVIRTLDHELEYWNNAMKLAKGGIKKNKANSFRNILEPFANELRVIDSLNAEEVESVLELGHNVLDDLWRHKPPFKIERMKNLMDIIGYTLYSYSVKQLKSKNVFFDDFSKISEELNQHISLGEKWLTSCDELTRIFWANYGENMWTEPVHEIEDLKKFLKRLKEILNIRTLHKQLVRLLTFEEQEQLDEITIYSPFKDLNLFSCGQHTEIAWMKARKEFERLLLPAERKVGYKLKKQLSGINSNTRQLLYEFSRYSELISRPYLKETLQTERQYLLNSLYEYVRKLQTQTSASDLNSFSKYDSPLIIKELMMTRQLETRAKEVQTTSNLLLNDLNDFDQLNSMVVELLNELKKQHAELFESWTSEINARINDKTLSLKETDPVVQFSNDKLMKVNYSPRLVLLINEVRQLNALGYNVPLSITETAEHAKKFMNHARILEQIANFHNTIGDLMITSQRPMMLKSALELSKLVEQQEVVSWSETKHIEIYVENLKKVVEDLSEQNNLLTSHHHQIMKKIEALTDVDLITSYREWKDAVKYVKNIISQVEQRGFPNMDPWINDISKELAKVLEKQYVKSLDELHMYLPEIHADLVYRNSMLEFSPSEDELKTRYEQSMQNFLDIPKNFYEMFEFGTNIFHEIIEKCRGELKKPKLRMNELFNQLQEVLKYWKSWIQIGDLDLKKLTKWQHWDLHFKMSKTFGQEIAKLPSTEEKVGCFIIGLSRLRSDLESHNRSYWDQLASSLKDSIARDVVIMQNFIDPSTAALTKHSVTLEEIAESGATHLNILKQVPEMENTFTEMVMKSQVLSSWTREQVDAVNRLKGAWERLQSLMENYQHIVAKQMETIKTTLNIESENVEKEIERFVAKWEQVKPKNDLTDKNVDDLQKVLNNLKEKQLQWEEILKSKEKLILEYEKYGLSPKESRMVDDIGEDVQKVFSIWKIFEEFHEGLSTFYGEEWIVFRKRMYKFEEYLQEWQRRLSDIEKNDLIVKMIQIISKFLEAYSVLKYVRGDDFTEKHWMDVFNILQIPLKSVEDLTLKDFLLVSDKIEEQRAELQAISRRAASEIVVRQALSELDSWEVQAKLSLSEHKDSLGNLIMVVKDFKEPLNKIGDNQSLLQSVKNSTDYESFADRASLWETKLCDLDFYLTSLAQIQRRWLYLEPIFGNGTLDREKSRFQKANKDIRQLYLFISKDVRILNLLKFGNLRSTLVNLQDQLFRCQKSLDELLAEKRDKFPRFYFLGDDDLLEVIGQSSKEQVIQSHLKKIFSGIHRIELNESGDRILSICSEKGEIVKLNNFVIITKPIEEWLNELVLEMHKTLKDLLVHCLEDGQSVDPSKYPLQILCLANNIIFTLQCEQAVSSLTLTPLLAKYKARLAHFISLGMDFEENITLELKLKALILDTIHQLSIIEELIEVNLTKVSEWTWQKQLRFYSNSLGEITVKMANSRMGYSYEYLGNVTQLVRTPLTEQCFITLTQGMHLGMGGNPYGPAGTGKTETVKALGALLGRQVLVFNCDEGIDSASMARILSGLVRSGAWGCFDEFNRLDEATLSAISTYIHSIQVALKTGRETLKISEQEMKVNKYCGIFVTLNPAGGSYGGRNKLPVNLKQLFRPIVMTHPNHEMIAKVLLLCEGYQNAEVLAGKLIEVFTISDKILSKQKHYDWGLRAIKTVLIGCGKSKKKHFNKIQTSEEVEMNLVVNVLRSDIMSKLTYSDAQKFRQILKQVFKMDEEQNIEDEELKSAIEDSFVDLKLVLNERQVKKCLELYEQLQQRMGVSIVGPQSSGKTTVRNLLRNALQKLNKKMVVNQYVLNPKSVPRYQLLGQIDPDTRQWNDGILSKLGMQISDNSETNWIVCDGDVDPEWVESLNSVLDDNRLLTLPSGWRIQFGKNVNFIFETHNLNQASPATISRMGIVLLSEEDLSVNDFIENFVSNQTEEFKKNIGNLLKEYLMKSVDWILTKGETSIPCSKLGLIKIGLSQLINVKNQNQFIVSILNGLGQILQNDFREIFAQEVFEWFETNPPVNILRLRYNVERDMIETFTTNPNSNDCTENNLELKLVETGQIMQSLDVLMNWLEKNEHFLVVGPHGSAKSCEYFENLKGVSNISNFRMMVKKMIRSIDNSDLVVFNCDSNLKPDFVIEKLTQNCISVNTSQGVVFRPKKGILFLYFKNLDLLKPDKWGTNIVIEFLTQLIKYKAFYDSGLQLVTIQNVTIIGSFSTSQSFSPRFTSIINIYNVDLPDEEDLTIITIAYLQNLLTKICEKENVWPKIKVAKIVGVMMNIFKEIRVNFTKIQQKHYVFSTHDLMRWCSNILLYQMDLSGENGENNLFKILFREALGIFLQKVENENDLNKMKSIIISYFEKVCDVSSLILELNSEYFVPTSKSNPLTKLSSSDWSNMVERGKLIYERDGGHLLDIIVNKDVLDLVASVSKILNSSLQNGHLVLVGQSGIGRRAAVKIVSALYSTKLVIPISDKQLQLKNELKNALQTAGLEGEDVYLLVEDHFIQKENFLNSLNSLILSGEIPGLYNGIELNSFIMSLGDEKSRMNFEGSFQQFFSERIKQHLHVIICVDKENENLQSIFEFPAFVYESNTIWINNLSEDSMKKLPETMIERFNTEHKTDVKNCEHFLNIFDEIDIKVRNPRRYIESIQLYNNIFKEKISFITSKQSKLKSGVDKLTETKYLVSELKQKAAEQEEILAEKQRQANSALDMISVTMQNANVHKEQMETLKSRTESENQQLIKRKKEIELELVEVEPLIQEARSAVGKIKSEALTEIRSLRAPPETIRDILEGVLRLMGIQDTSWNSMKNFLAKRGVKEEIRSFDAGRISLENRQAVERLIAMKSESFSPSAAKRASVAAAPLAAWVSANVQYSKVVEKIKPLEKEQYKLKQNLSSAEAQLGELNADLSDVDATVAKLKSQLSAYTKEAAEIEINLKKARENLTTAESLVEKLIDEFERWQQQLEEISVEIEKLPFDCVLAASFIAYLPQFYENERREFLKKCLERMKTGFSFNFEEFMSSKREQMQWQGEGLPNDKLSIQNAIMITKSNIIPLIIDPTSNAVKWVKNNLKFRQIESLTQDSPNFANSLELAVRFGKVLVVEEVNQISHSILCLSRKELVHQGERRLILLNGKLVDYHPDFKLILSSRDEHLKIPPDCASFISVMNFTLTHSGFTEQLISFTISQENTQLKERKNELFKRTEELQEQQYKLQEQLLEDMANSSGDILQNVKLIQALEETKTSFLAVSKSITEQVEVEKKLNEEYEVYRHLSAFGSALYFAVNEFSKYNILYTISASAFTRIFLKSVQQFQSINDTNLQKNHLINNIYSFMARGMFKEDRIKFGLHITQTMFPNKIPPNEWKIFLQYSISDGKYEEIPEWIPKKLWYSVQNFQNGLPELYNDLRLKEQHLWSDFMLKDNCETRIPNHCSKLTDFQKVLLVQALRPDRLYTTIQNFTNYLNDPSILNMQQIYKESVSFEPILLITTSGNDPSNEIQELATRLQIQNYEEIAMGEGQERRAISLLQKAGKSASWVVLKNLHLVSSWLAILCQNLNNDFDENFRLWLITEVSDNFNFVLAQSCLKIVHEAPKSIKFNIQRTFNNFGAKYLETLHVNSAKIFFALACLHAVLQERRTYIPQGWSKWYDFSDVDFSTCVYLMEDLWQSQSVKVAWNFLKGLCSSAVYGGRIENVDDLDILESYLNQYFNDEILSHKWRPFNVRSPMPNSSHFNDYMKFISDFPSRESPTLYGLPQNIEKAWEAQKSTELIKDSKQILLSKTLTTKFKLDSWCKGLNPFLVLWKKLNQGHDFVRKSLNEENVNFESAISRFLHEEFNNAVRLVQKIHKSFTSLNKICKKVITPESEDLSVGNSLLNQKTPNIWLNYWERPIEPTKYLRTIFMKIIKLSEIVNEDLGKIMRNPISLSAFFHPEAFLASYKLEFSNRFGISLDELVMETTWKSQENSLTLTDLMIECAQFDGYNLKSLNSNNDNINNAPNCYIGWKEKKKFLKNLDMVEVPLFSTSNRTKKLAVLEVPCNRKMKDEWVQAGVAFFVEI